MCSISCFVFMGCLLLVLGLIWWTLCLFCWFPICLVMLWVWNVDGLRFDWCGLVYDWCFHGCCCDFCGYLIGKILIFVCGVCYVVLFGVVIQTLFTCILGSYLSLSGLLVLIWVVLLFWL